MVIHNFDFVAGYGETTASWFAFSGNAGNKYMQHFRGADAVEDFDSELPFPRVEDFSRQCFTGRNTLAHRRKIDNTWKRQLDRKSTRLNSSHTSISYAVF